MKEDQIIPEALINLKQARNIKGEWRRGRETDRTDGKLELNLGFGGEWKKNFNVEVKRELRAHHLPLLEELAKERKPFMVIAENIFPKLKEELREKRIAYLDAAGNIFIHQDGIYLWLDGNKYVKQAAAAKNRAFTKAGLKVLFYFLVKPMAINETYQQIANATEAAIGNMKNIFDGLKDAGFILQLDEKRMKLINKRELLDRWMTGYREILKPALLIGHYKIFNPVNIIDWQELAFEKYETYWGGEPAAQVLTEHLRPEVLTVYTDNPNFPFTKKWMLFPDAENGKVKIYRKFWKGIQYENMDLVPTLLVYVDLLLTNDPRNLEVADIIWKRYLQKDFE